MFKLHFKIEENKTNLIQCRFASLYTMYLSFKYISKNFLKIKKNKLLFKI